MMQPPHLRLKKSQTEDNPGLDFPQPATWAKWTLMVMLGGMAATIAWSALARIDSVVTAQGKLEPFSGSQSVQAQTGGVITTVQTSLGATVKAGQTLMTVNNAQLDTAQLFNQLSALLKQREPIAREISVLRAVRQGSWISEAQTRNLAPELVGKIQAQRLFTAQLSLNPAGLNPDQQARYRSFVAQLSNQDSIKQLEVATLQAQASGNQAQSSEAASRLRIEQQLLAKLGGLAKEGGVSQRDYLRQVEATNQIGSQLNQSLAAQQQLQLSQLQAQVNSSKNAGDLIRGAEEQLAAVNQKLDDIIESDQQKLTEIDAQVTQIQAKLKPQKIVSPVAGRVFQLATQVAGTVAQPGQVLAQVTPDESVIVQAQVSSADLASLSVGMPVEVRLDAYPYTQFGAIHGSIRRVGSEAVPIDRNNQNGQTVFPIEVLLDRPFLQHGDKQLPLAPGMTASLSIKSKIGSRAPISYVLDPIFKALGSAESVR